MCMADYTSCLFADLEQLGSASGFVEEIHEVVKTLALFDGFSRQECEILCQYMTCYGASSRTAILREGDRGDFMVIVLTGRINVMKVHDSATSKMLVEIGPGGFIGEMSLIDGQHRFASCISSEPSDFAVLTRDSLNEILVDYPRLGNKLLLVLLQTMASRLRETTTRMLPTIVGVPA